MHKIAILHGGPADRQQHIVDHFSSEILYQVMEPMTIPLVTKGRGDDVGIVRRAIYRQASPVVNPARDHYWNETLVSFGIPDHEVVLYVFAGVQ